MSPLNSSSSPLGLLSTFCFPTSTCNAPKQQGSAALSSITVWTQPESYCELPHQRYEWKDAYTSGAVVNDWFFCLVAPRIFAGDDSTHSATASLAPAHHMMATRILTQNNPSQASRLTKLDYAPPSRFHHHPNPTLPRRSGRLSHQELQASATPPCLLAISFDTNASEYVNGAIW